MEHRRRTDVDDVDVVHAQHFVEGPGAPRNREFLRDGRQPRFVDIAQCHDAKLLGVLPVPLGDVVAAYPASDDRNSKQVLPHG